MSQNPNARRIENLEFGKKEERREDSFAHLINLPSPKGEKVYIYIKIGRFQFTSCERNVGSIPTMETMEREEKDRYKDRRVRHNNNKADYARRACIRYGQFGGRASYK